MANVFISYSREDREFVHRLFDELEKAGQETWVDWEDIEYAEDWWKKICAGIEAADNFVFVMTPDSVRSQPCCNEISHAVAHHKRIVPILHRPIIEPDDQACMHNALSAHNWLPFGDGDDFDQALHALLEATSREPNHVRSHTRLSVQALDWERNQYGEFRRGDRH
jgi:hypothetical protein